MPDSNRNRLASVWTYAVLALMPVLFSSNLVIGRVAVFSVEPITLAFWRWLIAAAIMLPFVATSLASYAPALRQLAPRLFLLGFLGMAVCGAGVYIGLRHTTATNGTLIYTTSPAFIVLIEMIIGRRPFSVLQLVGIALATFGVAVIVLRGDVGSIATLGLNSGDILVLAAAIAWAVYSVLLRDRRIQSLPDRTVFAAIAAAGAIVLAPFWLVEGASHGFFPATGGGWVTILALAIFPSVLAFLAYQWLVRRVGPARTGMALYFLPIVGVAEAVLFLGESVYVYHLVGTLLTVAGVAIATLSGRWKRGP